MASITLARIASAMVCRETPSGSASNTLIIKRSPARIFVFSPASSMRSVWAETDRSPAMASMRAPMACARRSAGYAVTPRTRNRISPSSVTVAVAGPTGASISDVLGERLPEAAVAGAAARHAINKKPRIMMAVAFFPDFGASDPSLIVHSFQTMISEARRALGGEATGEGAIRMR
jgi:hypothetical protein